MPSRLQRGMRVVVTGSAQVSARTRPREGEKRTVIEMEVEEIGPSLKYATAKVNRHHPLAAARVASALAAGPPVAAAPAVPVAVAPQSTTRGPPAAPAAGARVAPAALVALAAQPERAVDEPPF